MTDAADVPMPEVPAGARAIPITGGSRWQPVIIAWALVSEQDYPELAQYRWGRNGPGYAVRHLPRDGSGANPPMVYMHRQLLPEANRVDHINRDKLDNRRENLRSASASQNVMNQDRRVDNRSGYRGVYFTQGRWVARVKAHGKLWQQGGFSTAEDAARWRDGMASVLHGEYFSPSLKRKRSRKAAQR